MHRPSRPEQTDPRGVRHAASCEQPGYRSTPSTVLRDLIVRRCAGCGATLLDRQNSTTQRIGDAEA